MLGNSYVKRFIAIMFLVAAILFMFSSCATKKDIVYVDRYTDNQVTESQKCTFPKAIPLLGLKKRRVDEANMFVGSVIYYVDNIGNIVKK